MSNLRILTVATVAGLATLGLVGGATTTSSADADGSAPHAGQRVVARAAPPRNWARGARQNTPSMCWLPAKASPRAPPAPPAWGSATSW